MDRSILIVEDDALQREMLQNMLRTKLGFGSYLAEHGRAALSLIERDEKRTIKLAIIDVEMPVMDGFETLKILQQKSPSLPVIMLTGRKDAQSATRAMKLGAVDYISKPYEPERMLTTIRNAIRISTLSKEVKRLSSAQSERASFDDLIGAPEGLRTTIIIARKAAGTNIPILITGETGTGKEVFARAIHGESMRGGAPFIAVNCGAIPAQLVESSLFGHEKGAFTGATEKVIGKFREAEGGTIFLDEVGELPLETQVKLLRVLQQGEVEPVGAGKPLSVNVRVISATNRNLIEEIKNGKFREDLYFRLNVLPLELPPLRRRANDILPLTHHFIERFCARENRSPKYPDKQFMRYLETHHWPGNVRELENTINHSLVMSDGDFLSLDNMATPRQKQQTQAAEQGAPKSMSISLIHADGSLKTIKEIELEAMLVALSHHDGNITQTAQSLGMAKSTFYKKMPS